MEAALTPAEFRAVWDTKPSLRAVYSDPQVVLDNQISRENARPKPESSRLAELHDRLQKARVEYESFQTSLYVAHPELRVQRGEAQPIASEEFAALIPEPTPEVLEERIASGNRLVGDPDECARGVQMYADVGCDQLIFGLLASNQPQEVALHTAQLFGRHVIPRFDRDPVHSTTRMREAASVR